MNKIINILETWEKQWDCVSNNFSSRNKINKQKKIKKVIY